MFGPAAWLRLKRIPEPELMDEEVEVASYADAASESYLRTIDLSFVDHVERLMTPAFGGGQASGTALDIGCGPGQIPIIMARRWPELHITGIDAGPLMIERARREAAAAGVDIEFRVFRLGPYGSGCLPCDDSTFDLVTCNSTLHHLADPVGLLDEVARVVRPSGAVLIRDLVRPPLQAVYPLHVRWFGRHYCGEMRRLYEQSVRAAYTPGEMQAMLDASKLSSRGARVFRRGLTHAGIERRAPALPVN